MLADINRLFTFAIITAGLTIIFLGVILVLAARRLLIPGVILLGSFVLFVLWLTTLIETAIQLFGKWNCNKASSPQLTCSSQVRPAM